MLAMVPARNGPFLKRRRSSNGCLPRRARNCSRSPAIGAGAGERIEQGRHAERDEDEADKVEAGALRRPILSYQKDGEDDGYDANWHVDVKNQLPTRICHQIAAERRAEGWSKQ